MKSISLNDALKTLTFREREIVKLRYGVGDGCPGADDGCYPCGCSLAAEFEITGAHICDCVPVGDWELVAVGGDIDFPCSFKATANPTFSIVSGSGRTPEEVAADPFP